MDMQEPILNFKRALAAAALLLAGWPACAQVVITNVQTVNVTPSGFSVVASVSPAITSSTTTVISVFSDPGGVTNLAGQVGVQLYPLNSGDPGATNAYSRLQSEAVLQQDTMALGLVYARISDCAPDTTYYYKLSVSNTNGQSALWPASGPLPAVTTALQNSFVLQSQQLLITLDDSNPTGAIITLSTSNSSSVLAAVVGDGASSNQVFFNVNDLIAASGGTNYAPVGSQLFTASLLGPSSSGPTQTYSLIFSNTFSVGQPNTGILGALSSTISLGTGVMLAGSSSSVPITLDSQGALVGLSFVLNLPTNLFTAMSVQATTADLSAASLSVLSSNTVRLSFTAATGQNLQGSQQIAQLNLTAASNQSSAFVPLLPQALQGTNAIASISNVFSVESGRVVIIGPQPLLDMQLMTDGPNLVLYGIPGLSYQIQSSANLARSGGWSNFLRVPMTNLTQVISNLNPPSAAVFFRAYVLNADPPILQTFPSVPSPSLLAFGLIGTNYTLQYATNLSATVAWYPFLSYTLTNSFEFFTNVGTNPPVFYRIKK
jgi:hypothetical protein